MMQQPCQKTILLDALIAAKPYGISTVYAIEVLGILCPAARVFDLRKRGNEISVGRTTTTDSTGRVFKNVAVYTLLSSGEL
jgi:hypothetical protein